MRDFGRYQKGASIWLVILVVVILGFGAIFALKLIPIYLEGLKVEKAVAGALQGDVGSQAKKEIKLAIVRRMDIDDVRRITEQNFEEYIKIDKRGSRVRVDVDYKAEEPLFYNVSVLVHFEKTFSN